MGKIHTNLLSRGFFLPWNKLHWRRLISLRANYPLIRHHRKMVILLSSIRGKLMSIASEPPIWNEMLCGEWTSNRFVRVLWLHRATAKNSVCPCWVFEKNQPSKSSLKFLCSNALESRSPWAHSLASPKVGRTNLLFIKFMASRLRACKMPPSQLKVLWVVI